MAESPRVRALIASIEAEFERYRRLAEVAMDRLDEDELAFAPGAEDNSVAVLAWHLGANLHSRFTDFLDSDGEKPWRRRDEEFHVRRPDARELREHWNRGFDTLFASLQDLDDGDLAREVTIRGVALRVHEALHRALAHVSYHVGQIVYLAKSARAEDWESLSIPRGGSAAYAADPTMEKPSGHVGHLERGS